MLPFGSVSLSSKHISLGDEVLSEIGRDVFVVMGCAMRALTCRGRERQRL